MAEKALTLQFDPITGDSPLQVIGSGAAGVGTPIEAFFTTLLAFFTVTGGLAFLIYFILGAFAWITSRGEKEKIATAQRYMGNALVGLLYLILAWAVTGIIGNLLGVDFLNVIGGLQKAMPK